MIYLLRKNLEILPFVIIPELSPQIFNDELAIDFAGGGRRRPVGSAGGGSGGGGTSDELALECVANG